MPMHHPLVYKQRQHPRLLLDTGTDRSGQQHLLLWQQSSQEKRQKKFLQQRAWLLQTRPSWPKSLFGPLPCRKELHAFIQAKEKNLRTPLEFLHCHSSVCTSEATNKLGMPAVDDSLVSQQKRMTFSNGDLQHTKPKVT